MVWAESVETLARVSCKHPQFAYAGLHKSLQQEWAFLQWVTSCIVDAFGLVEKAMQETFVPELFEVLREGTPEKEVTRLPRKQSRLALSDPTLHRTPRHSTKGPGGFMDDISLGLYSGGSDGGLAAEDTANG